MSSSKRMPSFIIFFFFFKCSAAHPALHSFPTRRSSDLIPRRGAGNRGGANEGACRCAERIHRGRGIRSEEHTSELQSRFDLVCRLLLEKTKLRAQISRGVSPLCRTARRPLCRCALRARL